MVKGKSSKTRKAAAGAKAAPGKKATKKAASRTSSRASKPAARTRPAAAAKAVRAPKPPAKKKPAARSRAAARSGPAQRASSERKTSPKKLPEPFQERLDLLLQEKNELQNIVRRLKAERDSALAEGTRLEERVRELEGAASRQAGPTLQPAGPGGFDPTVDLEEEEEEAAAADDELEGAAGFFDRIEEMRARRIELDRERNDRELEQSDQSFWLICPKCGDLMEEQEAENVKLERCDNCGGLYLDRGEADLLMSMTTDRDGLRRIHNVLRF